MIECRVDRRWRVHVRSKLALPLDVETAWGEMRDLARFATADPFHARVQIMGGMPCRGARLTIEHRYAGIRLERVGRILSFNEGRGYCFSDLSRRGRRVGFPHVYRYELKPSGNSESRLLIDVRGRWTATWVPRPAVRLWLTWVMLRCGQQATNRLMLTALRGGESTHSVPNSSFLR